MSGQPTPPIITEAFAVNAGAGYITNPFPVPSQIPLGSPGKASLNDGFPPLNMIALADGGIPMSGKDLNGILYLTTAQVAALAAGQLPMWDADLAAAMGGYALGAVLGDGAGGVYVNVLDANPDEPPVNWRNISQVTQIILSTVSGAGTYDNVQVGPAGCPTDVDSWVPGITGDIVITGFQGSYGFPTAGAGVPVPGQTFRFFNDSAHNITFMPLTGSDSGNQIYCVAGGITIAPGQSQGFTFRFNSANTAYVWAAT